MNLAFYCTRPEGPSYEWAKIKEFSSGCIKLKGPSYECLYMCAPDNGFCVGRGT
jgi:hypothetical protein